ncbi:flippase [Methanobacterium sp.]|uniref:flippase n=1 Tax=Methanobacterium sp. TaxID=2164 RepID=UPI0025FBF412|nr:flippase [Methanobacterium sp.]MBI5459110.1 flippase [Methanobacterium sp.]MDY9923061.1 flippase [Methanobacterium sp.]
MNKVKGIAKNMGFLFISQIITYIIGFFITMYTARYLGAEGFGILSLALSITGIFGIVVDMGLGALMIRELARDHSFRDKYLSNVIVIRFFLSFLMFGLLILTVNLIGYSPLVTDIIYIISLYVIINAFVGVFTSVFQSYEKMNYFSVVTVINSFLMLFGVIIGISFKLDIIYFASVYLITNALTLLFTMVLYFWKYSIPHFEVNFDFWKPTLKEALPYGLAGIFVTVYYSIDSVMLSVMVGNETVGWYNAAYKLVFVFLSLYSVFTVAIFPVMSRFYKDSQESLKYTYERSFKYLLIISIPIALTVSVLANKIILLIYGPAYSPSIIALQILIWTIIFMFINGLSGILLGSINRQIVVTKITGFSVILNVALNLVLIPKYSYLGASAATVITELVSVPLLVYILCKTENVSFKKLIKDLPKIIFSSLIMVILFMFLNSLNTIILLVIVFTAYAVALFLTRTFDNEDFKLLKSLINKN